MTKKRKRQLESTANQIARELFTSGGPGGERASRLVQVREDIPGDAKTERELSGWAEKPAKDLILRHLISLEMKSSAPAASERSPS